MAQIASWLIRGLGAVLVAGLAVPHGAAQEQLPGFSTNVSKRSVDLKELQAGGPPKDGIPALVDPPFVRPEEATWLAPQEPVIALVLDGRARAYPLQILIWHEIVNDRLGGVPVAVTFCPLCYSAVAFDRRAAGQTLTFGVSGMLRHSDMVMFDRQTETLWQQLTGEAIVGDLTGTVLDALPAQIISFEQFVAAYPDGDVLSRDTGYARAYGRNPYVGYDDVDDRPFLYRGPVDDRLPPMMKVVTLSLDGTHVAYPYAATRAERVIHDTVAGTPLVVFHAEGAVSALDDGTIRSSRAVGSTGVFEARLDGELLRFSYSEGYFVDQDGTTWDVTGRALDGPRAGRRLTPLPHGDYFAFAWFVFRPDTRVYERGR